MAWFRRLAVPTRSSELVQTLFAHDLVDELALVIAPIILGQGKRMFGTTSVPGDYKVISSKASPKGVILITYQRNGDIKTGSFALEDVRKS